MANILKVVEKTVQKNNWKYNPKQACAYGMMDDFLVLVELVKEQGSALFSFCAAVNEALVAYDIFKGIELPKKANIMVDGFRVKVLFPASGKADEQADEITEVMKKCINCVKTWNGVNCDDYGVVGDTQVWQCRGEFSLLTGESATQVRYNITKEQTQLEEKKEHYVLGVIGALLGSLAGVLLIFLVARIGYITSWGGIVLGIGTVFGYKKLAGKFSKVGAVITIIVSVLMTYVAARLDAAMVLVEAFEGDLGFGECFLYTRSIYEWIEESALYFENLVKMMVFGVVGSVGMSITSYKEEKAKGEIVRIS